MRIFKDMELVELLGSGILEILDHCGRDCFHFYGNFLNMGFPAVEEVYSKDKIEETDQDQVDDTTGGQIGGQIEEITEALPPRQREVLTLILRDKKISRKKIAEHMSINESAVQKHLAKLKEKGILEGKEGTRGYWRLNIPKNKEK